MRIRPARIPGVFVIELEPICDDRGWFARTFCVRELATWGLRTDILQCSVSINSLRGTLRGLHWQAHPHAEVKLIRCPRGRAYDVLVDVRQGTPGCGQWEAFELDPRNGRMLYVPEGVAHGFQTLEDDTELAYQMSAFHEPSAERGLRWNDPGVGIRWPLPVTRISERDAGFPDFAP
jgi:dTDP-4-dehydrorhamnose 3,5-epimerase